MPCISLTPQRLSWLANTMTAPDELQSFPTLEFIKTIISTCNAHGIELHPAVLERLGRAGKLGPGFFPTLARESSDLSDLRLRYTTDQLMHLKANLANARYSIPNKEIDYLDEASVEIAEALHIQARNTIDPGAQTKYVI